MEHNREERRGEEEETDIELHRMCVRNISITLQPLVVVVVFFTILSNHVSFIIITINGIFSLLVRVTLKTGVAALLPPATHFSDTRTHARRPC